MKLSIRILVKLSLIVIVLLGSFSMAQAQKQNKINNRPHCKVFLKNGKVVDSYLMAGHTLFIAQILPSSYRIIRMPFSQKQRNIIMRKLTAC